MHEWTIVSLLKEGGICKHGNDIGKQCLNGEQKISLLAKANNYQSIEAMTSQEYIKVILIGFMIPNTEFMVNG